MIININFNSDEPIYVQLKNQIILLIAKQEFSHGDCLPSVRKLAKDIGINMHTVNKAYNVLREEGFLIMDRRSGAIINIDSCDFDENRLLIDELNLILAKAYCKNISKKDLHNYIDKVYEKYERYEQF